MKNKKILLITGVIVVIIIIYCVSFKFLSLKTVVTTPNITNVKNQNTEAVRVPIQGVFGDEKLEYSFNEENPMVFGNQQTTDKIILKGVIYKARNSGTNLYVNQEKIGEIGGMGILSSNFSPNNKYFSFVGTGICGASCEEFNIYVVDLQAKKFSTIKPPRSDNGGKIASISSLEWINNSTLKLIFYFEETDGYRYYRISPKELWNYDLITQKYILAQTLPE